MIDTRHRHLLFGIGVIGAAATLGLAGGALGAGSGASDRANAEPLRVCLISGSWEYRSEDTLPVFAAYLEDNYPMECTLLQAEERDRLPGLEALAEADAALVFTRRLTIDGKGLERVQRFATSGKPIVGVRTASHGFQNWLAMDAEIFGGNYRGHYSNDLKTAITVAETAADHPILDGFEPYETVASLYQVRPLAEDCEVLLVGTSPEGREPLAWVRDRPEGRVVYTSLGHPFDFEREAFRRFLARSILWSAGRLEEAAK